MLFFFIIFGILSFVPIVLFALFSFILKFELDLIYYYLIEFTIVLLITSIAQYYYYQTYDFSVFPSGYYFKYFLVIPVFALVIIYFLDVVVVRWLKKEEKPAIKILIITMIVVIFFFNWYVPLGQKYYHVKRLEIVEENFTKRDTESVTIDGDIMITLVESEYDKILRSRSSSSNVYNNYFYIRNNGNKLVTGSIYLILYNKNNEIIDTKLLPEIELDAQTTQLLVFNENKILQDEWDQYSFGTKQRVVGFKSTVTLGK